jgi:RND family efflux transporter MFP subunit
MVTVKIFVLLALALSLISLCACQYEQPATTKQSHPALSDSAAPAAQPTDEKPTAAGPPVLDNPAPLDTYVTSGPLIVENQVEITAARDGEVTNLNAEIGDKIRSGQILARLNAQDMTAQRAVDEAKLRGAQAEVRDWEAEELAVRADLARADKMYAQNLIALEAHEHAKYKLQETREILQQRREAVNQCEAELHVLDVEIAKASVAAPFDGVIGRRYVARGQRVKQGDRLFWITAQGPMRVVFTVPQRYFSSVRKKSSLELTAAAYPGLHQPARIIGISPVVDPSSGSIEVIAQLTHPSPLLRPGMSVDIHWVVQK